VIRPEDMDDLDLVAEYQRWATLERCSPGSLSEVEALRLRPVMHEFERRMRAYEEERVRKAEAMAKWRAEIAASKV
jgi:hypothetical protein